MDHSPNLVISTGPECGFLPRSIPSSLLRDPGDVEFRLQIHHPRTRSPVRVSLGGHLFPARETHVTRDQRLISERFPRTSQYHPDWVLANASGGANSLWLTEWLTTALDLRPGMRVLDLGCGRASSSIFLRREFGVQVWAVDLWISAAENIQRIRDAGVEEGVFPLHVDARSLPFAPDFFDAVLCVDSFYYYGTDDLYLNYLAQFVKPGCPVGVAGAGVVREIESSVPDHLAKWWTQDLWAIHSADWWRRHWERTGIMDIELADTMPDGWKFWLDWQRTVAPDNATEIKALEADVGRYLGYVRLVGRRRGAAKLEEYCWPDTMRSFPPKYTKKPLLRSE
jgi:SAM-dependent methyltransferase